MIALVSFPFPLVQPALSHRSFFHVNRSSKTISQLFYEKNQFGGTIREMMNERNEVFHAFGVKDVT